MYEYSAEVAEIVGGDSIWLEVDVGFRIKHLLNVRLNKISTSDPNSAAAETKIKAYEAKDRLLELLPVGSKVRIRTVKSSKYGQWLADIWVDDGVCSRNVNDIMLEEGYATNYTS